MSGCGDLADSPGEIQVADVPLERVDESKYLGSYIGSVAQDIRERCNASLRAFGLLMAVGKAPCLAHLPKGEERRGQAIPPVEWGVRVVVLTTVCCRSRTCSDVGREISVRDVEGVHLLARLVDDVRGLPLYDTIIMS